MTAGETRPRRATEAGAQTRAGTAAPQRAGIPAALVGLALVGLAVLGLAAPAPGALATPGAAGVTPRPPAASAGPVPGTGPTTGTGTGTVVGSVSFAGRQPAAGVIVDLFAARSSSWNRGAYLGSTASTADGSFQFAVDDGCYVVVLVAPLPATFHAGSTRWQQPVCVRAGRPERSLDATLQSTAPYVGRLQGRVTHRDGEGAGAVVIEIYLADGAGGRGPHLRTLSTASDGRFGVEMAPGCYTLVVIAPAGDRFAGVGAGAYRTVPECVTAAAADGPGLSLASSRTDPPELSPVEREIVRLTNELRADPDGPLARRNPLPDCVDDQFYDITLDPATGQPQPVAPVTVDTTVAAAMSRAWARDMARWDSFEHRTSAAQQLVYDQLDRRVSVWGENIAWFAGYDPARAAQIHFEGWRESETGHYCSMLTPRFTHIGVGELFIDGESWAVQNFYG